MRSGEVAARAGVNPQTLRYYERRGILPTPSRRPSGYRAYADDVVDLVRFIKRAQALGFTLDEVDILLGLAAGGPESCEHARALAMTKVAELDSRLAALSGMRAALLRLVDTCDEPPHTRSCPLIASLQPASDVRP
jgi:MerR family transcriptional regulator, mercuric resistance operon regulatory protein